MRLIDGDALRERVVYADLSTKTVDALIDFLAAAPTVSCEGCRHWSKNDYGSGECSDPTMSYVNEIWTEQMETAPDFGCPHFEAKA